jgi:hypothetical protein
MKRSRSIGAVAAGFATAFVLSVITDVILEQTGIMKMEPFSDNAAWLIMVIIASRTVYNGVGCYITARLAPARPLRHAMTLGWIGLVFSIAGTIAMWDTPPHWYPVTLIILTLPVAWVGGKLGERRWQRKAVELSPAG